MTDTKKIDTKQSDLIDLVNRYVDVYIKQVRPKLLEPDEENKLKKFKDIIFNDVHDRLQSTKVTKEYLKKWDEERGYSEEIRIPEDASRTIIENMYRDKVI